MQRAPMKTSTARTLAGLVAVALALVLAVAVTSAAQAEPTGKTLKAQGKLVAYDAEAQTITLSEKGTDRTYQVKAEGSVLTKTTVTMNARPAKLTDLPPGAPLIVYWKADSEDKKARFARKIDAPKIPEELLEDFD